MLIFRSLFFAMLLTLSTSAFGADEDSEVQQEIEYLLTQVSDSGCIFIRNGSEHDAADAADHMRMKYGNGKRWVSSAEDFINRIASKSSWSGKKYQIQCPGEAACPSGDWLTEKLSDYRAQ